MHQPLCIAHVHGQTHRNYFHTIENLQDQDPTVLRNGKGDVLGGIDAIRN